MSFAIFKINQAFVVGRVFGFQNFQCDETIAAGPFVSVDSAMAALSVMRNDKVGGAA